MEFECSYGVYVKTDPDGYITTVNSSAFLADTTGWTEIGRGYGDRYHHAQGNFFSGSLRTDFGAYRYKLADGIPAECSETEIAKQESSLQMLPELSQEDRLAALETQNQYLTQRIQDLSELLAGLSREPK